MCPHLLAAYILLSDRSTLTKVNKTADVIAFYNLALHSSNSNIIAFTPSEPPQFSYSSAILEEILKDGGRTLVFMAQACSRAPQKLSAWPSTTTIIIIIMRQLCHHARWR
jgi:hypothetical protein